MNYDMKTVKLRAMEPEDLDNIYRWENAPEKSASSTEHRLFSRHELTQFLLDAENGDIYATRQQRLMAVDDDHTVGFVELYDFDPYNHRAGFGVLVDDRLRGQGYGVALMRALESYCRSELQLHVLWCDVMASNLASRAMLRHCGFSEIGIRRDWLCVGGGYEDAVAVGKVLQ